MKKSCAIFISIMLCFFIGCCLMGCCAENEAEIPIYPELSTTPNTSETQEPADTINLRVITESSHNYGMNQQVQLAKEAFETTHKNVIVEVIILPVDVGERALVLEQLQEQRMLSNGPDIYLLPTGNFVDDSSGQRIREEVVPVFDNVTQSMQKGLFADISEYYDADATLNKENLNNIVMNAGVIGNKRYVIPLRYDAPVIYADLVGLEKEGITGEDLEGNFLDLMNVAIESNEPNIALAVSLAPRQEQLVFNLTDFDNHFVLPDEKTVQSILEKRVILEQMSRCRKEEKDFIYPRSLLNSYVSDGYFWCLNGYPIYVDSLRTAIENSAIFIQQGRELTMLPLTNVENEWIASVTYYGAIDAESKHVGLSYEFLRMFLTEEYQWAQNMELAYGNSCLIHDSWPVRITGSVTPLWSRVKEFLESCSVPGDKRASLARPFCDEAVFLNDDSISILQTELDDAVFPTGYEDGWDWLVSEALKEGGDVNSLTIKWVSAFEQQ